MSAKATLEKNFSSAQMALEQELQTQKQQTSKIQELESMHRELAGCICIVPLVDDSCIYMAPLV